MMPELSLNVLDVAQNSVRAGAKLTEISVCASVKEDTLAITIKDDGCGMSPEQVEQVIDPFFTTRTTRKVGLGVPFFKLAAETAGGSFQIDSAPGVGTSVNAVFQLSHIDRMPLGDMPQTIHMLVTYNPQLDFLYIFSLDDRSFTMDTREFRDVLEGAPLDSPEVSEYIREFLEENTKEVLGDFSI